MVESSVFAAPDVSVELVVIGESADAVTAGEAVKRSREGCLSEWGGQIGLWNCQMGRGQTDAESA